MSYGCTPIIKHHYAMERNIIFHSKKEYISFIKKKYPSIWTCFIQLDSVSHFQFIQHELINQPFPIYWGCYLNDSTKFNHSDILTENPSCLGRIEKEIVNNLRESILGKESFIPGTNVSSYHFKYLCSGIEYRLEDKPHSIHIFLLYTSKLGSYYDGIYKKIIDWQSKYEGIANFFIISIDPLYHFQD